MRPAAHIFLLAAIACGTHLKAQDGPESIRINQEGYYTGATKIAVVTGAVSGGRFCLVPEGGKDTVYRGTLSAGRSSANSSTRTRIADFSPFQKKGRYRLWVPGVGASWPFSISDTALDRTARTLLKGFYFIRSNEPLDARYAGTWARPAGHPDTAVLVHPSAADDSRPAGTVLSTPGGWYDAGDYNKYIVNAGITMGTLLSGWEDYPAQYSRQRTGIPESGDAVPDLLNEVVYNLRWMLTMQDPGDGGVYHKCTNAAFDGMVMPGVTKLPRYVVRKSTAATLDFAAVTAQASRVLRRFTQAYPGLSDSCRLAARRAWDWALIHPDILYDQRAINAAFDPDISTGEYGDRHLDDEWLWAACELWVTTRDKAYRNVLEKKLSLPSVLPSWASVGLLGYYTLLRFRTSLPADFQPHVRTISDSVLHMARGYLDKQKANAFATVIGGSRSDFVWGSNAVAANQGMLLLYAWRLSGEKEFLQGALSNMDYILGRNATGYCFVTGLGSRSTLHPHHRPSVADGVAAPVPGLLAGGPNPGRQDGCPYPFTEPETAYVDSDCAYASNEIAINWNAPAVYLANALAWELGKNTSP